MARPADYFPPMRRTMAVFKPGTPSQNTAGEDISADVEFVTVRCALETDSGQEATEANQQQATRGYTIFCRARTDLTTAMYGVINGRTFNFTALIAPLDSKQVVMRIQATERVN